MQPPKPPPVMRAPNTPGTARGDIDHHVDLGAADLEVVAHAEMGFAHQPPDESEIAGLERGGRPHRAVVLGDDVAGTAIDDRRQEGGVPFELVDAHVA